jgi:hypothetical protein
MAIQSTGPIDIRQVQQAHSRFQTRHALMVQREAEQAGRFGVQHVHDHPDFKPRTGNLQKKTSHKVLVRRGGKILRLQNTASYAHAIDLGAKPHVIRPRRARALRFITRGKLVFARKVNHPGNKPYRFLYNAADAAGRVLKRGLEEGMEREARRF